MSFASGKAASAAEPCRSLVCVLCSTSRCCRALSALWVLLILCAPIGAPIGAFLSAPTLGAQQNTAGPTLGLVEIYDLARQNDPDFRVAVADRNAGVQAEAAGLAPLLPQISFIQSTTQTERMQAGVSDDYERNSSVLNATLPIINTGNWHGATAGARQARAARAAFDQRQQELILKVAEGYLGVLRAQDALAAAEALRTNMQTQVQQVQSRYSVGLSTLNDLEEARYGLDNAVAVHVRASSDLEVARLALAAIIGRDSPELLSLSQEFREWPPAMTRDAVVDAALKSNPFLQALISQRDASRAQARAVASAHLPTLDLNLTHTESDTDQYSNLPPEFGSVLPSESTDTVLQLSVRVPLFSGGAVSAQRRQAAYQHESLKQQVLLSQRNVRQQVLALHARALSSVASVQATRQALRSAESAEEATMIRYRAGTRNTLDVSTASRISHDARLQHQSSRYDHILLHLQLEQAMGSLGEDDLHTIDLWLQPVED